MFPAEVRLWLSQGIGSSAACPCFPSQDQGQQKVCPKAAPSASLCFLLPAGERRQVLVCAQDLSPTDFRTWSEITSGPGLQNQFRYIFKIAKSYFALTVTRIYSLCAVWCNAGRHSLSLFFFDVLPNVSELCRHYELTDHSAWSCGFQRKPSRAEMQNRFQSWRRLIKKTVTLSRSELL